MSEKEMTETNKQVAAQCREGQAWETTACYNGLREEAAAVLEQERGDALTLRGFIATYKMTPSMMASRAETAEARVRELEAELAEAKSEVARYWTSADIKPWCDLAEEKGLGHFGKKLKAMFSRAMKAEDDARIEFDRAEVAEARLSSIEAETIERAALIADAHTIGNGDQYDDADIGAVLCAETIAAAIRQLAKEVAK